MTESANGAEGWRPDPFGRHETRFHDGTKWTPYVKDGETHSLDEPVEGVHHDGPPDPEILTAPVLVVEQRADSPDRSGAYSVFAGDGRGLGSVRPSFGADGPIEVLGGDGRLVLTLTKTPSSRKSVVTVRGAEGTELGRLLEQHLPGMTTYALESAVGINVGFVRARTWVGWDIRVEDEHSRPVARISKHWDGLDQSAYPVPDSYVVRVDREMRDPQRALVYAAALSVDSVLKKDTRGFQ